MPLSHMLYSPVGVQKALDSFTYHVFTEGPPYTSLVTGHAQELVTPWVGIALIEGVGESGVGAAEVQGPPEKVQIVCANGYVTLSPWGSLVFVTNLSLGCPTEWLKLFMKTAMIMNWL